MHKNLTLGSLFDGSGTFPMAGILSGITPIWASEIEPFPIRVTTKRLPYVKHLGDINHINGAEIEPVDIITFGSPCTDLSVAGKRAGLNAERSGLFFQAVRVIKEMRDATNGKYPRFAVWENVCFAEDTLITCENGYKRIKDVSVGERVKTHTGRFMPVVKVYQTKKQQVLKLRVSGSEDTLVTPNHPFLAVKKIYSGKKIVGITEPEWIPTEKLTDKHLIGYRIDKPILPENFMTKYEAWAVGRWIADGSIDLKKSNPRMFFSIGIGKEADARENLNMLPYTVYENKPHPTATNFCFTSHEFYALISDAGTGAGNKQVPPYVFQLPFSLQKAVLDGYLSGDGYIRQRGNHIELSASTASRELAYGISRLIRNVYRVAANISVRTIKPGKINGRELHVNYPCYAIEASLTNKVTTSVIDDDIIWQPVKSVEFVNAKKTVYNLSVLEDNTYAANDIIVHNCGAFSSNGGEDFRCVLKELCKVKDPAISVPKPAKWTKAGEILGDNFTLAYRTVDAQYWYTPQRRMRIYLVADFDGGCAPKILFESEGVSGYSAESVRAWKEAARSLADCSGTTGTGLVFSNHGQDTRFKGPVEVAETISASYGTGGNNQPFVVESAGFCTEHSAKARGIGYEEETSPTLRAGIVPATLKIRCGGGSGGKGALIQEDKSATLSCNNDQTLFVPKAYGICSKHSNSMMSDNPNSGFYEADTARTIDTSNQSASKNQGGIVVVEGNGSRPSHHGDGYKESDTMYTLNCTENHAVSYGIGRPAMNQGYNAKFSFQIEEEKSPTLVASGAGGIAHPKYSTSKSSHHTIAEKEKANTLVASDYKDPPLVNDSTPEIEYIVRRLTPQECALLQGMPTWWCDGLETENPTDEEIDWWYDIFETHRKAMGKSTKPKSRKQVEKWLKNPYSDSAAYKMWGNGVYVGNAWFVLAGIAYYANLGANCERSDTKKTGEE